MTTERCLEYSRVWDVLTDGIRHHLSSSGFTDVVLGLSGGMDSALVAALAVDALGKDHVHGILMPSPWSSQGSIDDSLLLAENLGMPSMTIPIAPLMQAFETALAPIFAGHEPDVTEENLQARIRGVLLMALSNKFGWMTLATGNKSELNTGYCTLYGDMCGGLAPIAALYKTEVYALAEWYNQREGRAMIPQMIFDKPPSAELRPDQTDQDSLPPYDTLDAILYGLVDQGTSPDALLLPGIESGTINRVAQLMRQSAFKRRFAPPSIEVEERQGDV